MPPFLGLRWRRSSCKRNKKHLRFSSSGSVHAPPHRLRNAPGLDPALRAMTSGRIQPCRRIASPEPAIACCRCTACNEAGLPSRFTFTVIRLLEWTRDNAVVESGVPRRGGKSPEPRMPLSPCFAGLSGRLLGSVQVPSPQRRLWAIVSRVATARQARSRCARWSSYSSPRAAQDMASMPTCLMRFRAKSSVSTEGDQTREHGPATDGDLD